jgi:(p)ppGpp synthase/HD superfamily hydrolase
MRTGKRIKGGDTMLERAIILASGAHAGQFDKIGQPYILHPLRVMLSVTTDLERVVAVLHDVVEDTSVTLFDVLDFGNTVADAIDAISKHNGEPYHEYLKRVKSNPLARTVKIADVRDNTSPARLYQLEKDDILRLTKKYAESMKFLQE